jgi:hypothetical protein
MSDEPRYSQQQLNAKVWAIMRALMEEETGAVDGELSLDALAFVAAVIFDMNPAAIVPSNRRKMADQHGEVVRAYLQWAQRHFDEKGVRFGEMIGGETHLTGDLPPGHTRH